VATRGARDRRRLRAPRVEIEVGAGPAADAVQLILDAAARRLGPGVSCYAGRGALLIDSGTR